MAIAEESQTTPTPRPAGVPPELSYEQARGELATVVERLESGAGSLEASLALWERGEELAAICQYWLDGARSRIAAVRANNPGNSNAG